MEIKKLSKNARNGATGERIAREIVTEYGWWTVKPDLDCGEDLLVKVVDDDVDSGLSFYFQVKTPNSLEQSKSTSAYRYKIKVNDIQNWSGNNVPVFILLCDAKCRMGFWVYVEDIINELNVSKRDWQTQANVTINFPKIQNIDEKGLRDLRKKLVQIAFPQVSKGKTNQMKIELSIPDTQDGRIAQGQFQNLLDSGEGFELPARFIKSVNHSEWFTRIIGKDGLWIETNLVFSDVVSNIKHKFRFTLFDSQGHVTRIFIVTLSGTKVGKERATLTNMGEGDPYNFEAALNFRTQKTDITFTMSNEGMELSPEEWLKSYKYLSEFHQPPSIKIEFLKDGNWTFLGTKDQESANEIDNKEKPYLRMMNTLMHIEEKIGVNFQIKSEYITRENHIPAEILYEILTNGKVEKNVGNMIIGYQLSESGEIDNSKLIDLLSTFIEDDEIEFYFDHRIAETTLLNQKIELGPCNIHTRGKLKNEHKQYLKAIISSGQIPTEINFTFENCVCRWEYENWISDIAPNSNLSQRPPVPKSLLPSPCNDLSTVPFSQPYHFR